ncbi:MAG: hypothetical protein ACHQ4H_06625 [Ktedonobacterales bacterium]
MAPLVALHMAPHYEGEVIAMTPQRAARVLAPMLIMSMLLFAGCAASSAQTGGTTPTAPAPATALPTVTPTPQPACATLDPGSVPFTGLNGVPGLTMPAGTYISGASTNGGGSGQYTVVSYTLCFQGGESAIDGGSSSTTVNLLKQSGWKVNNLFPDPTNFSYLDYCSNSHICLNTAGSPNPFIFAGFDDYVSHSGGYTTFRTQFGTITAPTCLNDPTYYTGTPKYTLYEDGNSASSSNPTYHFQMPPGTRVSTYTGGGTAGSTYVYFCSSGTQATIVAFLKLALQNGGWTISNLSASGFNVTTGNNPTYSIAVNVQNPNNYSLRIFVPM